MLTETQWEIFFDLLSRIANSSEGTWEDRKEIVRGKAIELDAETALEEFTQWFGD